MQIQIIAARARNNVIGRGSEIPWRAKGEQKLFKDLTMGSNLVMGRKTFESIGRPLPGRETIIVSRQPDYQQPGCQVAGSLESALEMADNGRPLFIAGGGELYAQALPRAEIVHLTTIDVDAEGDIFFPQFPTSEFELVNEARFITNLTYTYQKYVRRDGTETAP